MKQSKKSGLKNEIDQLRAKLALARLALKGKVKRKANFFKTQLKKPFVAGDIWERTINELTENNLETGQDFQRYFEICSKINSLILMQDHSHQPFENFMSNDFKTELSIIKLIKDCSDICSKLNYKISSHNQANPKEKINHVDSLIFESLVDVNRIFVEHQVSLEAADEKPQSNIAI